LTGCSGGRGRCIVFEDGVFGWLDDFIVYHGFAVDVGGSRFAGTVVVGFFGGLVVGVFGLEGYTVKEEWGIWRGRE
jgi:hypothetical protein